jgi:hypothetical protein
MSKQLGVEFMKKQTILIATAITLQNTLAWALPTINVQKGLYQAGSGGEFAVTVTGSDNPLLPAGTTMQTFCLEYNEHIGFNQTYYVEINTETLLGGIGGGPNDPLDPRTAWLYNQFADQTLAGYDFDNTGAGRKNTARSLQNAIWFIEEEITSIASDSLALSFVALAEASDWYKNGNIGAVRVLNLWKNSNGTGYAQDQLFRLPAVPAPGAIMLGSVGTLGVGFLRRRYFNA